MADSSEFDSWYRPEVEQQPAPRISDLPTRSELESESLVVEQPAGFVHNAEAYLAAFVGTLMSFLMMMMLALLNDIALVLPDGQYLLFVFALTAALEGPLVFRLWAVAASGERPIGPVVAQRFGFSNRFLRFLFGIWWLIHIAIGMTVVISLEIEALRDANGVQGLFLGSVVTGLFLFGTSVCCNVYIALFVKALTGTDSAVRKFWTWRLLVDLGMTIVAFGVVYLQ